MKGTGHWGPWGGAGRAGDAVNSRRGLGSESFNTFQTQNENQERGTLTRCGLIRSEP